MKILLLSMPDSFEHTPALDDALPERRAGVAGRQRRPASHRVDCRPDPGAALGSRDGHAVWSPSCSRTSSGFSVMTFQRKTARKVIALVKALLPAGDIVVGGYDPSLAPEAYDDAGSGVDVIVHGEGDITFRELLRALEAGRSPDRRGRALVSGRPPVPCATRPRAVTRLETGDVRLPNRAARVLERLHDDGPARRRRRDVARLHLRLQLLLDHRDARTELPHVGPRPRDRRHRRRAGARRAA